MEIEISAMVENFYENSLPKNSETRENTRREP